MNHDDGVTIYRCVSANDCHERALVLQAVGVAHEVRQDADGFSILVSATDADRSAAELDAYATENRDWIAVRTEIPNRANGWDGVLFFGTVLLLIAVLEQRRAFGLNWFAFGETNAGLIRQGEWWRAVTALTLHVDLGHLLANLFIGSLLGLFAGQSLGSGFAWFMILMGGALGNLLNATVRHSDHTSVGASTAVFAALGLLVANAWRQRRMPRTSKRERWVPLVGGVLLLSYLGTSGERTDVAAHVFGFMCGTLTGGFSGKLGDRFFAPRAQFLFGLAALTFLALAWTLALVPRTP
ncbi:MAG: rhomboid family intramembrane serine protease [Planctomycetota bacterium]